MKKRILIGTDSFEKIIKGNFFYVDKTLFIKELLENKGEVTLITRPRRFGKTMNMSMLRHFFDVSRDSKALFAGLKIMEHADIVATHLNKYPVISLTLKDVEERTYKSCIKSLSGLVAEIYRQNRYLYESDRLNQEQKDVFYTLLSGKSTEEELKSALKFLTECLYTYYQKRVIILLDEYDAPINNALMEGYYTDMIEFMRRFLGSVFKSNDYLEFGVLTGVQRIAKEGLVSSFNNPKVCGIMSKFFTTCFGFTEEEVKDACRMYELGDMFEKVESWYNGFRFGGQAMYNPWSITGYLDEKKFKDYWVNTGSMEILEGIFFKGSLSLKNEIAGLLTNKPIIMTYVEHIRYPILYDSDDIFWSMLLNSGYIKPCEGATGDRFYAELVNREVRNIFDTCIRSWFSRQQDNSPKIIRQFVACLLNGDKEGVSDILNNELLNTPSYYDLKEENSYHMFIFGILLAVSNDYIVYSNPESGKGRSDCLIKPIDKAKYAIVIEFKHSRGEPMCSPPKSDPASPPSQITEILKSEAQKGLLQIEEKAYIHNLKREGYERIHKYCIAFHKKNCEVAMMSDANSINLTFLENEAQKF